MSQCVHPRRCTRVALSPGVWQAGGKLGLARVAFDGRKSPLEVSAEARLKELTIRLEDVQQQAHAQVWMAVVLGQWAATPCSHIAVTRTCDEPPLLQFEAMKESHGRELSRVHSTLEQRYRAELAQKVR